ncbi:MAG: bacteriohemerythrin [Rhodospirillales bacterium]|nr:bacteriohemerythrin [Rhodospirillales bacterium]
MLAVVLATLFFIFDISLPLGVAGGVPYVALVLIGIWFPKKRYVYALAIIGSTLTVVGYFASPPGSALWIVLTNRALALAVIWISAILIAARKQAEIELAASVEREALQKNQSALVDERLHNAIESFPDGFVLYDPEDRLIMCNQAFHEMWAGIDDLIKPGVFFHQLADAISSRGLAQKDEAAKKQTWVYDRLEHGFEDDFLEIKLTNGRWILHHDHRTTDGGHAGIRIDITERKHLEMDMLAAKKEAEKSSKAKSEFLASMSHELRTPLNAVLGFAQMLLFDPKNPLSQAQNVHVESILEGGNHLLELVNEILDLAKIEANQLNLSLEEVNANDVVADCVALSIPLGEPRDITIIDQFSSGSPSLLRTDRLRFKQALINLLSNAIKFNNDGGTVSVEGHESENGFLRISVTDTGVGIAEEDYESVFHMFHRLGADPMISREGTGIGLTVTKLLVEQMAGRVGFESEEGAGSTFWLELPLASNEDVLIWASTLLVGVDAIDKDHQVIFSLLNRVTHGSIDDVDLDEIIMELIDYTQYHFRREEAVMEACGYPDLEKHRAIHRSLTDQVSELADTWRSEHDPELLYRFRKFLRDWLFRHIMKSDTEISQYTKGKEPEIRKALELLQ